MRKRRREKDGDLGVTYMKFYYCIFYLLSLLLFINFSLLVIVFLVFKSIYKILLETNTFDKYGILIFKNNI